MGTATARIATDHDRAVGLHVHRVSLDGYLAEHPKIAPDLVKIDVEGHEVSVLVGMTKTLAEQNPAVVVELHGRPEELVDVLEEAGYVVSVVGPDEEVAARDAGPSAHLFARPQRAVEP